MGLDDSSCDTVLVLGLALYDGTTPVPVASSIGDEYSRRRLQLKKEHHRQQPIVVTAGSDVQHYDAAPLEPSLTLALSAEVGGYGVDGKGKGETGRPGQVVDYQYSSSSTMFPQQHQLLQYTSCRSLSLSSPSASTFSNSCLSSGAAVKRERVDAAPHHAVVAGDEAEGTDVDDKALEVVPTSPHAAVADDFDGDVAASSARKKLRLTKEQSALLEERFKEQSTLNPKQKLALAKQLNLRPRQVEVWFQNRRARTKLKQTEVDCEFLRRCCETLADENRRLHRELQELKAIKFTAAAATISATAPSPPSSLQYQLQVPGPAAAAGSTAAFTMCPGCQRISPAAGTDVVKQAAAKATSTAAGFAVAPKAGHVM